MINTDDQNDLFQLISDNLEKDIECIAIGGTAMMFQNYKATTKDIDLVFESVEDRACFIRAIERLGYSEKSLKGVYDINHQNNSGKPIMYSRGDERFDLFVRDVFGFSLNLSETSFIQKQEFLTSSELIVHVLSKEYLILLKAITDREKDFEDIETIIEIEKNIDWDFIIDIAIKQKDCNEWILIDLEKTMHILKKQIFLPSKYFDKIYTIQNKDNS